MVSNKARAAKACIGVDAISACAYVLKRIRGTVVKIFTVFSIEIVRAGAFILMYFISTRSPIQARIA